MIMVIKWGICILQFLDVCQSDIYIIYVLYTMITMHKIDAAAWIKTGCKVLSPSCKHERCLSNLQEIAESHFSLATIITRIFHKLKINGTAVTQYCSQSSWKKSQTVINLTVSIQHQWLQTYQYRSERPKVTAWNGSKK